MSIQIPEVTLGVRLYMARKQAHLEQAHIAEVTGVSRALVSRWERDLSEPKPSQLRAIAQHTGVSYSWLIDPENASFVSSLADMPTLFLPDLRPAFDFARSAQGIVAA